MNKVEKCGKYLKDPMLLVNIVDEIQKEGVVGEEDTVLCLILKVMLRHVKCADATSSNVVVSDKSGGGKDFIVTAVCNVLIPEAEYYHRTGLTEKIFTYWNANKKEFTWNGKVIHLEDPCDDLIASQGFKTMASGGAKNTVVKDQKAVDLKVNGKPVLITTSYNIDVDVEGIRRWDTLRMDTSKELTSLVIRNIMLKKSGLIEVNENKDLREALKSILAPKAVKVPFMYDILKVLPNTLAMRTICGKFVDYIKASAVLYQMQREHTKDGCINATWEDYEYARFVFAKMIGKHGVPLNSSEETFMKILIDAGVPLSINEIAQRFDRSKSWIYRNVNEKDKFKSSGLIKETQEWDDRSNKEITKYYTELINTNIAIPPSWFFHRFSQKRGVDDKTTGQKENGGQKSGFVGFPGVVREVNKKRHENGLKDMINSDSFIPNNNDKTNTIEGVQQEKTVLLNGMIKPKRECENQDDYSEKRADKTKPDLMDKIKELIAFMTLNKQSGYSITYDMLIKNNSKQFIDKCIEDNIIFKFGDEYVSNY